MKINGPLENLTNFPRYPLRGRKLGLLRGRGGRGGVQEGNSAAPERSAERSGGGQFCSKWVRAKFRIEDNPVKIRFPLFSTPQLVSGLSPKDASAFLPKRGLSNRRGGNRTAAPLCRGPSKARRNQSPPESSLSACRPKIQSSAPNPKRPPRARFPDPSGDQIPPAGEFYARARGF